MGYVLDHAETSGTAHGADLLPERVEIGTEPTSAVNPRGVLRSGNRTIRDEKKARELPLKSSSRQAEQEIKEKALGQEAERHFLGQHLEFWIRWIRMSRHVVLVAPYLYSSSCFHSLHQRPSRVRLPWVRSADSALIRTFMGS